MDALVLARLERYGSVPRFVPYRSTAHTDLEAITLYFWNIQLAEALFPTVATLEVALRNAVHDVLTYWQSTEMWFAGVLHPRGQQKFTSFYADLTNRLGHVPTAGKIVSELTFGFWSSLFTHHYHALWWNPPRNPPLRWVFPNHPNVARDTRTKIGERLEYVLALRNRMMHHETIFDGVVAHNKSRVSLAKLHSQMIEMVDWLSVDAVTAIRCMDRFNQVYDPIWKAALAEEIKREFGIL